jgi:hypothetical protein
MSVLSFQQALCDMIASPWLHKEGMTQPDIFLHTYDLTPLEEKRLLSVMHQKGMAVNHLLYKSNRITPIYSMLPYTTLLLDKDFLTLTDEYIQLYEEADLQFSRELELYLSFLEGKIKAGLISNIYVNEILHFEAALTELRFAPRNKIAESLLNTRFSERFVNWMVHPLIRVVVFDHSPAELFEQLAEKKKVSEEPASGRYYLVVDGKKEEPELRVIHPEIGKLLLTIKTNPENVSVENAKILFDENLIACL